MKIIKDDFTIGTVSDPFCEQVFVVQVPNRHVVVGVVSDPKSIEDSVRNHIYVVNRLMLHQATNLVYSIVSKLRENGAEYVSSSDTTERIKLQNYPGLVYVVVRTSHNLTFPHNDGFNEAVKLCKEWEEPIRSMGGGPTS